MSSANFPLNGYYIYKNLGGSLTHGLRHGHTLVRTGAISLAAHETNWELEGATGKIF